MASEQSTSKQKIVFEPIRLPSCYNVSTLNDKVIKAQHYKLSEKFRVKLRLITQLEKKIEELDNRHNSDEKVLSAINRHWNQLDDVLLDLCKNHLDTENFAQTSFGSLGDTNFLNLLSQMSDKEVSENLEKRVSVTGEAFTQMLKALNKMAVRRNRILLKMSKKDASPEDQEKKDKINLSDEVKEEIKNLLVENKKLEAENLTFVTKKAKLKKTIASQKEELDIMQCKYENATNQLNDLKYEVEKGIAREEKLECQLIELKRQQQEKSPKQPATSTEKSDKKGDTAADVTQKQFEDLQHELEVQTELAEKRLQEINTLSNHNQELNTKVAQLNNNIKFLPTSVIRTAPDYMFISLKYNGLIDESRRVNSENILLKQHIQDLRASFETNVSTLKSDFALSIDRMRELNDQLNHELGEVKNQIELIALEADTTIKVQKVENSNYKDLKALFTSMKNDVTRTRQENSKLREEMNNLKQEHKEPSSSQPKYEKPEEPKEARRRVLTERYKSMEPERLRTEIVKVYEERDKLVKDILQYKQTEEGLMAEIESTTTAVDDLIKQNSDLMHRITEQEETQIKYIQDGLNHEALLKTLKNSKAALEEEVKALKNQRDAMEFERQQHQEDAAVCRTAFSTMEVNMKKMNTAYEQSKKSAYNLNMELGEYKVRTEKHLSELTELREQVKEKASESEAVRTKIARFREERNILKKKLQRAKEQAECQDFDELLMEENKILRESLKCPSCKTNDKNTVLTKCFHVFCAECIRKRYDGRDRKCPKCNAPFGANDFSRIYIE